MWRFSLFSVFLVSGCYLPEYLEYSSESTFIQYFEDQNVCVVIGGERLADGDTSWVDERCLQEHRGIIGAQKVYLDINDSSALVDLLIDSLHVKQWSRSCEILDDTIYYVYYFVPSRCGACNYSASPSGRLLWLHGFWITTQGGRIVKIVGIRSYS